MSRAYTLDVANIWEQLLAPKQNLDLADYLAMIWL